MQEIRELEARWRAGVRIGRSRSSPTVEASGLVLGTTTLLSKRDADGVLDPHGEEARLLILLSVAYGRAISAAALDAIRRASKHAIAGDKAMSAMHIALAGLGELSDPHDAARRIFIADGLLEKGFSPRDIFAALDFDPEPLDVLEKDFNPGEPRVPAGSGRVSGEWTRDLDAIESATDDAVRELPRVASIAARAAATVGAVAEVLSDALPPAAFVTALLIPTPAGGRRVTGAVEGRPDLFYSWNSDETELKIVRKADNKELLSATLYPDGTLRQGPKRIGRKLGDAVIIDPFALPPEWPDVDKSDDDRRMCPKERPDRPGRKEDKGGDRDRDFEDYMKALVNPGNPTPRGMGYAFFNPETGNVVIYDDCQKRTGYLFDAKGKYLGMLTSPNEKFRNQIVGKLLDQANRQIAASQGRRIFWVFA